MEIIQLCKDFNGLEAGPIVKLPANSMINGPIPLQISTTNDFNGSVVLEGTLSNQDEVNNDTVVWSPISGAIWEESIIDALFVQVTHIRVRILDYISGLVSVRLGS